MKLEHDDGPHVKTIFANLTMKLSVIVPNQIKQTILTPQICYKF